MTIIRTSTAIWFVDNHGISMRSLPFWEWDESLPMDWRDPRCPRWPAEGAARGR